MRGRSQTARLAATMSVATALLLGIGQARQARAETIVVNNQVEVIKSDIPRPTSGMTMQAVEQRFGAPRERHPTVGKPPITRWDYDHFAVFFEKDRVIDAVVLPTTASPSDAAPVDAAAPIPSGSAPASAPASSGGSTAG